MADALKSEEITLKDNYGNTEIYYTSVKCQEIAASTDEVVDGVVNSLTTLDDSYNEMISLIPRFGKEFDSLGDNTNANITSIRETTSSIKDSLSGIKTIYYNDAVKKDAETTDENKEAAQDLLNIKTQESKRNAELAAKKAKENNSTKQDGRLGNAKNVEFLLE